ncbi:MAG: hypothetical protein ACRYGK_13780, partial [Janthinobacterium lividum]
LIDVLDEFLRHPEAFKLEVPAGAEKSTLPAELFAQAKEIIERNNESEMRKLVDLHAARHVNLFDPVNNLFQRAVQEKKFFAVEAIVKNAISTEDRTTFDLCLKTPGFTPRHSGIDGDDGSRSAYGYATSLEKWDMLAMFPLSN